MNLFQTVFDELNLFPTVFEELNLFPTVFDELNLFPTVVNKLVFFPLKAVNPTCRMEHWFVQSCVRNERECVVV